MPENQTAILNRTAAQMNAAFDKLDTIAEGATVATITTPDGTEHSAADVVLTKQNFNLGNVDNTADVNKPVSTLQQEAINNAKSDVHGEVVALGEVVAAQAETIITNKRLSDEKNAEQDIAIENKVSKGTYDPSLQVGLADNLVSSDGAADTTHIILRTTGGDVSLSTGPASFPAFTGMSVRQIAQNPTAPADQTLNTIPGHVYYVEFLGKHSSTTIGAIGSTNLEIPAANRWGYARTLFTASSLTTLLGVVEAATIKYIKVIDLTESHLESTLVNVASCVVYFGVGAVPYGVQPVEFTKFVSTGFNLYDASTMLIESATINASGQIVASSTYDVICLKGVYNASNPGYRAYTGEAGSIAAYGFHVLSKDDTDFDNQLTGYTAVSASATYADITLTENIYIYIAVKKTVSASAICHLRWSYTDFTHQYQQEANYLKYDLAIFAEHMHGISTYLDSADLINKVITRNIGVITLNGNEDWTMVPAETSGEDQVVVKNAYFTTPLVTREAGYGLCSEYTNMIEAVSSVVDKCIRLTGANIQITDTAYASVPELVQALSQNPIKVYYIKPTATTEAISSEQSSNYTANDFGTEEVVSDNNVFPTTCTVMYLDNLKDKLRGLPSDPISETGDAARVIQEAIARCRGMIDTLVALFNTRLDGKFDSLDFNNVPTRGGCPILIEKAGAPDVKPDFRGQFWMNTTDGTTYIGIAFGDTIANDWKQITA